MENPTKAAGGHKDAFLLSALLSLCGSATYSASAEMRNMRLAFYRDSISSTPFLFHSVLSTMAVVT